MNEVIQDKLIEEKSSEIMFSLESVIGKLVQISQRHSENENFIFPILLNLIETLFNSNMVTMSLTEILIICEN